MPDADFLRECAREYEDSAYACDTPLLRGFHASRLQKAKRLRELAARSPAPSDVLAEIAAACDTGMRLNLPAPEIVARIRAALRECDACNGTGTTGPNQPCQWCVAPPDQHPEVDAMLDRFQALCEAWHNEATYAERDELRLQILARMRPVEAPAAGTPNVELVQGLDGIWRYEPVSATKCYWRI